MLVEILAGVGATTGILSLAGVIYGGAVWKGGMDTWRRAQEAEHEKYPPSEIAFMCKTMWDVWKDEHLGRRPDLATRESPFRLTDKAKEFISEDVKKTLNAAAAESCDKEALASGYLVVKHLGIDFIKDLSKKHDVSVPEMIAILGTYVENHTDNCHPD